MFRQLTVSTRDYCLSVAASVTIGTCKARLWIPIHPGLSDALERHLFEGYNRPHKHGRLPTSIKQTRETESRQPGQINQGWLLLRWRFHEERHTTDGRFAGLLGDGNLRGWLAHGSS